MKTKLTLMRRLINECAITIADAARACRVSRASMRNYIDAGEVLANEFRQASLFASLHKLLEEKGIPPARVRKAIRELAATHELSQLAQKNARGSSPGHLSTPNQNPKEEEDIPMLLQKQTLTPEAREFFKLPRDPFTDDVQSSADVFQTANVRYVRAVLLDAAMHHGFVAITGESGAGKSTLAEDLEQRINDERRDVLVIRPYVLQMELNDSKGKTLKSGEIARAIIRSLDETATCKSSPDALMHQVRTMLRDSARSGRRHLLLIEEAHCLPIPTLKHLKRFLELKDGMRRLLGVALIAQPELRARLHNAGPEVREVAQRCELIELRPLDADVAPYLAHKFARFDLKLQDVLAPDAADAIRTRLIHIPRGGKATDAQSICYPLIVNNLVVRAMNAAAEAGYPTVDSTVIAGV
jgi:type II secretory pathway predicted ATPase ExeA